MASKFVLTAQLQLQAPTNTRTIVRQVQQQLSGVQMNVNPNVNTQSLAKANKQIQTIGASAKNASGSLKGMAASSNSLGAALGAAARRFASITIATGFFLGITRAIGGAIGKAIEFERELVKISQVTGKTVKQLQGLVNEVTSLSTSMGASSEELLNASRTLAQAGFTAEKVTGALKILAQTDLAATFNNIKDTTEGAIALLSQFRKEAQAAGGEVKFLEASLDAINSVSKSFAVESSDLISVIRRTGGVFEAAGGKLNELIALFTSVRATTRETADTIATGFRTIFTRIQRTETIDSLKELGIVLQDTEGKFIGPMQAIERLSTGLRALDPRDFRFNEIVEQLGGFRQIGKVIPLLKQYETSAQALAVANNSAGSTALDAATAQQSLGVQFDKLKEKFAETMRKLTESDTFETLAKSAIKLAESILNIVEALEPLLPMLTALMAFKLGQIALPAMGRFSGMTRANSGGVIRGFAGGGLVPGRGNRDTVPAMLQPGEFVMRKSAVKKIGSQNMEAMNQGEGYRAGGRVVGTRGHYGVKKPGGKGGVGTDADGEVDHFVLESPMSTGMAFTQKGTKGGGLSTISGPLSLAFLKKRVAENAARIPGNVTTPIGMEDTIQLKLPFHSAAASDALAEVGSTKRIEVELEEAVMRMSKQIATELNFDIPPSIQADEESAARKALQNIDTKTISGYMFEAVTSTLTGVGTDAGAGFDYPAAGMKKAQFDRIFTPDMPATVNALEAKRTKDSGTIRGKENSLLSKIINAAIGLPGTNVSASQVGVTLTKPRGGPPGPAVGSGAMPAVGRGPIPGGRAEGSSSGGETDTVAAMLTPGEFVLSKKSASRVGYGNLHRMNQSNGVRGFAAGGIVGSTRSNYGVAAAGGGSMGAIPGIGSASKGFTHLAQEIGNLVSQLMGAGEAISLAADNAATGLSTLDDRLIKALSASTAKFTTGLSTAGEGFATLDVKIWEELMLGATNFSTAMTNAAEGVMTVDDILREVGAAAFAPLAAAIADVSKGIATVDDIMRGVVEAMSAPLKAATTALEAEMKAVGTAFKAKAELLDPIKKAATDFITQLEATGAAFLEKADDLNVIKEPALALATSLTDTALFFAESADDLEQVKAGAGRLNSALMNASKRFTEQSDDLDILKGPAGQMSGMLGKSTGALMAFNAFMGNLNGAIIRLTERMNNQSAVTTTTTTNQGILSQEFIELKAQVERLEAENTKLILAFAKAQDGAIHAAGSLKATKPVVGGMAGGGGGMGAMGNQMMMGAMMAGMMATQMGDFSEATEKTIMAVTMLGTIFVMMAMELGPVIGGFFHTATAAVINAFSTNQNSAAKTMNTAAVTANSAAQTMGTGVMVGLALAATIVIARQIYLAEQAKALAQEFTSAMNDFAKGVGGGMDLEDARSKARAAIQKEAEAAGSSFWGWAATIGATIVTVAAVIALFAATILTGGAALAIAAAAAAAIIAGSAAAGSAAGAAFADAGEAVEYASDRLVESTFSAAKGLNELSQANQAMKNEQLEGVALMRRQGQALDALRVSSFGAIAGLVSLQNAEASMDQDFVADVGDSDVIEKMRENNKEMLQELGKAWGQEIDKARRAMSSAVDELREAGGEIGDIFADADIQNHLKRYGDAIAMNTRIQLYTSGLMKMEAKNRLGLNNMLEENMTQEQRLQLLDKERELIEKRANDDREAGVKAQKRVTRERLEAEDAAKKAADEKLASDIALAQSAHKVAMAMDLVEVMLLNMRSATQMASMELGALTGSIKQYKSNADKFIETLKEGQVSGEAGAAARQIGDRFNIESEVESLLDRIGDSARVKDIFTNKGLDQLRGGLDEAAATTQWENFLKDNNIDLSHLGPEINKQITNLLEDGLQPDEIQEIMDKINGANEDQIDVLRDLAKAQNELLGSLFKFGTEINKQTGKYAKAMGKLVDVQLKGAARLAKAQGIEQTVGDVRRAEAQRRGAPLRARGLAPGGVLGTQRQISDRRARQQRLRDQIAAAQGPGGDPEEVIRLQNEQKKLSSETKALTENLKKLANQSKLAAAIMSEIGKERAKRETVQGLIKDFTFADNQGRQDMDRNFMALQRVLQTGTLASIPDELRGAVGGLLDTLKDVEVAPGMTGGEVSKRLQMQMANQLKIRATGRPLTAQEMQKIWDQTPREEQLVNDLRALNAQEQMAAAQLAQFEADNMRDLITAIQQLVVVLNDKLRNLGMVAGPAVNAATGGSIWAPHGTDTVPAMLTPGEFVVNKGAAQRNAGALRDLNRGKTQYLAGGGVVREWFGPGRTKEGVDQGKIHKKPERIMLQRWNEYVDDFEDRDTTAEESQKYNYKKYFADLAAGARYPNWPDEIDVGAPTLKVTDAGPGGSGQMLRWKPMGGIAAAIHAVSGPTGIKIGQRGAVNNPPLLGETPPEWKKIVNNIIAHENKYRFWVRGDGAPQHDKNFMPVNRGLSNPPLRDSRISRERAELGVSPEYKQGPLPEDKKERGNQRLKRWIEASTKAKALGGLPLMYGSGDRDFLMPFKGTYYSEYDQDESRSASSLNLADHVKQWKAKGWKFNPGQAWAWFTGGEEGGPSTLKQEMKMGAAGGEWIPAEDAEMDPFLNLKPGPVEAALEEQQLGYITQMKAMASAYGVAAARFLDRGRAYIQNYLMKGTTEGYPDFYRQVFGGMKFRQYLSDSGGLSDWNWGKGMVGMGTFDYLLDFSKRWAEQAEVPFDGITPRYKALDRDPTNLATWGPQIKRDQIRDTATARVGARGQLMNYFANIPQVYNDAPGGPESASLQAAMEIDKFQNLLGISIPDIGTKWLKDAKGKEDRERGEARAEQQRQEQNEAQRIAEFEANKRKMFDIFFMFGDQKAKALESVLGKYPGEGGSPLYGPKVPKYSKLFGTEGFAIQPGLAAGGKPVGRPEQGEGFDEWVAAEEEGGKIRKAMVRLVTQIPRNAASFNAMFPYLSLLGFDLFRAGKLGGVAGVNQNGVQFNPAEMATMDAGRLGALLDIIGPFANQDYKEWFKGDFNYPGLSKDEAWFTGLFLGGGPEAGMAKAKKSVDMVRDSSRRAIANMLMQPQENAQRRAGLFNFVRDKIGMPRWLIALGAEAVGGPAAGAGGDAAAGLASGGPVGGVFKPRGTDTVPAMLTPGEFVMKKSAVDKYGMNFMSSINEGNAGSRGGYMAEGGEVSQFGRGEDRRIDGIFSNVRGMRRETKGNFNTTWGAQKDDADQASIRGLADQVRAVQDFLFTMNDHILGGREANRWNFGLASSAQGLSINLQTGLGQVGGNTGPGGAKQRARFALGGLVPGVGSGDTVSAMLTPGEFVMKKSAVNKYGGAFMRGLNDGVQRFALGGPVLPASEWTLNTGVNMHPNAVARMSGTYANSMPGTPLFNSSPLAGAYKNMVDKHGRGVWKDMNPGNAAENQYGFPAWQWAGKAFENATGSLYTLDLGQQDGIMEAFVLRRLGTFPNVDYGHFTGELPNFGAYGPYTFSQFPRQGIHPPLNATNNLGTATDGVFAPLWQRFANAWPKGALPGADGTVGPGHFPAWHSFSGDTFNRNDQLLLNMIKSGQWNPFSPNNSARVNVAKIHAGWTGGLPRAAADAAFAAFPFDPATLIAKAMDKFDKLDLTKFGTNYRYFAAGGAARGTDTVPAMLTPGEYVMRKSAVDKYGTSFMNAINSGSGSKIRPTKGVQYRQDSGIINPVGGGSFGDIISGISTALAAFSETFTLMSKLSTMLNDTISSMANMEIKHSIHIDGSLHIPGFSQANIDTIVNAIGRDIADQTQKKIERALNRDQRRRDKDAS